MDMGQGIDDFPDLGLPNNSGKPDEKKVKTFSFGGNDDIPPGDDEPDEEEEQEEQEDSEGAQQLLVAPVDPIGAMPSSLEVPLDHQSLLEAAESVLDDPALKALTTISEERFKSHMPKVADTARVTRGWLDGLDQRHFFLALGYPGHRLWKLLDGEVSSMGQLRAWVNGLETVPPLLRRILTLEHLLDRRTLTNRRRMPTRAQIQDGIRVLPRAAAISEILHGFDVSVRDDQRYPLEAETGTVTGVREILRIVKPGDDTAGKGRQGSSLPLSKRLQGQGKPLGYRLLKPSSYCYNISAKSENSAGVRALTPQDAMELLNKAADLENQFGVYYSLRRPNTSKPWSFDNVEFIPTQQLDEERARHARSVKERDE